MTAVQANSRLAVASRGTASNPAFSIARRSFFSEEGSESFQPRDAGFRRPRTPLVEYEPVEPEAIQTNGIILRNLPYAASAESIKEFLQDAGEVTYIRVLRKPDGSPLGKALCMFSSVDDARKALAVHNTKFAFNEQNRLVGVTPLQPRNPERERTTSERPRGPRYTAFVKDFPADTTWQELKGFFGPNCTGVSLRVNRFNTPYALASFSTPEQVQEAISRNGSTFKDASLTVERPKSRDISTTNFGAVESSEDQISS